MTEDQIVKEIKAEKLKNKKDSMNIYIKKAVRVKLDKYCKTNEVKASVVIEALLSQFLNGV